MITDLLAGRILIAMDNLPPYLRHIQSRALQALGVTSARRWFAAPDVPSIAEQGYPHYYLYYAAQAFFHASPEIWQTWNRKNIKMLSATQNPDGSWDGQFGGTFSTAASLLSLALSYRYLPIYER